MSTPASPLRIAIAGVAGRMGQALVRAAGETIAVVGGTERDGPNIGRDIGEIAGAEKLGALVSNTVAEATKTADVWIDFTAPKPTLAALDALKASAVKVAIIGTTGLSDADNAAIAEHAKRIAIVKSGNFSLGVNVLLGLLEQAAQRLGPEWDIEISETHHHWKVDAPSGTALMLGEAAAKGRGARLADLKAGPWDGQTGARPEGAIAFAVTRAGSVIGDHSAMLASEQEIVTLSHRALDRAMFAKGALKAAEWAIGRKPGLYTMRDVLAL